jgi:hypothetical protein
MMPYDRQLSAADEPRRLRNGSGPNRCFFPSVITFRRHRQTKPHITLQQSLARWPDYTPPAPVLPRASR